MRHPASGPLPPEVPPPHISLREYTDARFDAQAKAVEVALAAAERYVIARFQAQEDAVHTALIAAEKAVNAALASADRAVAKAEASADKRFENVNEFRASLNDQTRTLMPRAEHEQAVRTLAEKIDVLTARVNQRDDRGRGMGALTGWIVSGVLLVLSLAGLLLRFT
jgi:hypothetical protein